MTNMKALNMKMYQMLIAVRVIKSYNLCCWYINCYIVKKRTKFYTAAWTWIRGKWLVTLNESRNENYLILNPWRACSSGVNSSRWIQSILNRYLPLEWHDIDSLNLSHLFCHHWHLNMKRDKFPSHITWVWVIH